MMVLGKYFCSIVGVMLFSLDAMSGATLDPALKYGVIPRDSKDYDRLAGIQVESLNESPFGNQTLSDIIGVGSRGPIYKIVYKDEEVAVKVFNLTIKGNINSAIRETKALRDKLKEVPNVVQFKESHIFGDDMNIIMEMANGRVVKRVLEYINSIENDEERRKIKLNILYHIVKALKSIHERFVCHNDISVSNVVIDKNGKITIIDLADSSICETCKNNKDMQRYIKEECKDYPKLYALTLALLFNESKRTTKHPKDSKNSVFQKVVDEIDDLQYSKSNIDKVLRMKAFDHVGGKEQYKLSFPNIEDLKR